MLFSALVCLNPSPHQRYQKITTCKELSLQVNLRKRRGRIRVASHLRNHAPLKDYTGADFGFGKGILI